MASINELARLLRPGGKALIYVWAMEQEYMKQKSKYLKENRNNKEKPEGVSAGLTQRLSGDQMLKESSQDAASTDQATNYLKDKGFNSSQVVNQKLPVHTNRTAFDSQDVLVPWHLKNGNKMKGGQAGTINPPSESGGQSECSPIFHRYYHVFCEGELEVACRKVDKIRIQQSYHDQGNWCVILEKL